MIIKLSDFISTTRMTILLASTLGVVVLGAVFITLKNTSMTETGTGGKDKADELVSAYSKHVGARGRNLDANNDVSYGDSGLHYDAERGVLVGRVLITTVRTKDAPEERLVAYRKMVEALNDPKIGGMFENGGGTFVLDEEKQMYFLTKDFPVLSTNKAQFLADMDDLQSIGAVWTTTWVFRVAMIMHGNEKAPTERVTRKTQAH